MAGRRHSVARLDGRSDLGRDTSKIVLPSSIAPDRLGVRGVYLLSGAAHVNTLLLETAVGQMTIQKQFDSRLAVFAREDDANGPAPVSRSPTADHEPPLQPESEFGSLPLMLESLVGAKLDSLLMEMPDGWLQEFYPLELRGALAVEGVAGGLVCRVDQVRYGIRELIGGDRLTESPFDVRIDGVELMLDGSELASVVVFEAAEDFRWVCHIVEGPGLGFQCVEVLFDLLSFGRDGIDPCLGVGDVPAGLGGVAGGAVAVSEAGLSGLGVGFPHGGPQRGAELVFELVDRLLVGLPRGARRAEGRLHMGQVGCGLGSPVGAVGDLFDEVSAAVFEPGPPWTEPPGDCQP